MKNVSYVEDEKVNMFQAVSELNDKSIILFGSGKMADYYLDKHGNEYMPIFIVDNNPKTWGTKKRGYKIKSPDFIKTLVYGTFRIIIAIANYEVIAEQLESMGIYKDSYRIYNKKMDELAALAISDTITDGKYNIGYVTGAFDLFHIGHLNILKRSKARSHYLIAGVLTDEIIINEKYKKPYIPFEERMEIVKQCRYVDRVVAVDSHNTDKINAWKELRYGCFFAGSDHEGNPYSMWLQKSLRMLGSNVEFFPYTKGTSSTILQQTLKKEIEK